MPLSVGASAPDFTLFDSAFEPFTLSEARGPVVLLFFPAAFSSTCTSELNTVSNDFRRYADLGAEVVGLSTDSPYALAEFKKVNGINFRLLSDHDADVAGDYEVKFDGEFSKAGLGRIAKRAAFVVSDGQIAYAEQTPKPGVEPDYEALIGALESAQ